MATATNRTTTSTIKCMIVEKFEERISSKNKQAFLVGTIIEEKADKVITCYLNNAAGTPTLANRLKTIAVNARAIITGAVKREDLGTARLTDRSKVLTKVVNFDVNMEVVNSFLKPDVVSVEEARGSPKKRRLSVHGTVIEVGQLLETPTYKRRMLTLGTPDTKIDIVLWGEPAAKTLSVSGDVTISALIVEDAAKLRSTPSTVVEFTEKEIKTGLVIAIGDEDEGSLLDVVLEDGQALLVPHEMAEDITPNLELPVNVTYTCGIDGIATYFQLE